MKARVLRAAHFTTLWICLPAAWLFSLTAFTGSLWWCADLFAHFRVQLLFGALGLALIFRIRRQRLATVLALAVGVLNLLVLRPHFKSEPRLQPTQTGGEILRCVSSNLLQGNESLEKIGSFVRSSNGDVLVFQEVSPDHAKVMESLKELYPGQLVRAKKDSKGAALLTKLPSRNLHFEAFPGQTETGVICVEVHTRDQWITVMGVHSHKPTTAKHAEEQGRYFEWLAAKCADAEQKGPVVLMGDFNSTPWSHGFTRFLTKSNMLCTSRGTVFGATWNVLSPQRLLIDHGFVSPGVSLLSRKTGPGVGSDHRPLILELGLPPQSGNHPEPVIKITAIP